MNNEDVVDLLFKDLSIRFRLQSRFRSWINDDSKYQAQKKYFHPIMSIFSHMSMVTSLQFPPIFCVGVDGGGV